MAEAILYTQPNCQPCKAAARALKRLNVSYRKVDISRNRDAYDHVTQDLGYKTTPVIEMGGDSINTPAYDLIKRFINGQSTATND